eukprot:4229273-Amphidinium_carterae.2
MDLDPHRPQAIKLGHERYGSYINGCLVCIQWFDHSTRQCPHICTTDHMELHTEAGRQLGPLVPQRGE